MEVLKVIRDGNRLRVKSEDASREGFIRFPRHLRTAGKKFTVDSLRWCERGYWIPEGDIYELKITLTKVS